MDTALWIAQVLLALMFAIAGSLKVRMPFEEFVVSRWGKSVKGFNPRTVKLIGTLELMGAIGVILPALSRILPQLTPLATGGLALTMLGAMVVNLRGHAYPQLILNLILLALAVFVIYGRIVVAPLA